MDVAGPPRHDALDHLRQREGRRERRDGAVMRDGAGDAARGALLAELIDEIGERALLHAVDDVGGAAPALLHPHVERPVGAEREAALRLVELHRGDADVEDDAVERQHFLARRLGGEIRETRLRKSEPPAELLHQRRTGGDRFRIAVERQHPRVRRRFENRARISARAECAVEIFSARARFERGEGFCTKHGNVPGGSACGSGSPLAAALHHSRAPCGRGGGLCPVPSAYRALSCFRRSRTRTLASSRCARKRFGSQI